MTRFFSQFTLVTLTPVLLLFQGAVWGGWWPALAVIYLTVVNQLADQLVDNLSDSPLEHYLKTVLPVTLAVMHFLLLATAIWALAVKSGPTHEKILIFIGFGVFFATVSNANGHELIHRRTRWETTLGKWIFISHLFGHHTSAHLLVHHPYVATLYDPNSARLNESFRAFWRRAWGGSFMMGLRAENARRSLPINSLKFTPRHPYFTYLVGGVLILALCLTNAGWRGVLWYLGLTFVAQTGLLLTDYVQHYGLKRREGRDGKFERISLRHSWNSPRWFTRHLTLNAVRHSDHHAKPARAYTELQAYPADIAPELPYPVGIMSLIAFSPRRWRKLMNPRVKILNAQQRR